MPTPTNKKLYEKAKVIVYAQYDKPSAYRSMAVQKKYKELGGKYTGDKEDGKLHRWMEEKWADVNPNKTANSYPVYRPTIRVNKDTPLTVNEVDKKNLKEQVKLKQKIKGKQNLPPFKEKRK